MRKNLLWFGVGLGVMSVVTFLARKIQAGFFQDNLSLFVLFIVLSVGVVLYGAVKRK